MTVESVTACFPAEWRVTVTVQRGGSRDRDGRVHPPTSHVIPDCLVGDATTYDPDTDHADIPELDASLLAPVNADVRDTDLIIVPACSWAPQRRYRVTGEPLFTPLGTRAPLAIERAALA